MYSFDLHTPSPRMSLPPALITTLGHEAALLWVSRTFVPSASPQLQGKSEVLGGLPVCSLILHGLPLPDVHLISTRLPQAS